MKKSRAKWGLIWIIVASLLWGFSYVPQELIWFLEPMASYEEATDVVAASMGVACIQALAFVIVLFVCWSTINGKPKEAVKNIVHWPISKWFLVSAIFGGIMAMFGSILAIAFIGADFASAIALLCAGIGAIYGRFMFKEILTKRMWIGIIILMVGGLIVLNPWAIWEQIVNPEGADIEIIIGWIGGILSAIGWGIESCYNVRGLDVADTEATTPARYFWEFVIWAVIMFPISGLILGGYDHFFGIIAGVFTAPGLIGLLIFTALSLGVADSLLHKAFPLIGVGRGLSINSGVYVAASLITLWVFLQDYWTGDLGTYCLIIGTIIAVAGIFIMYWNSDECDDSLRAVEE